jgi:putative transposase
LGAEDKKRLVEPRHAKLSISRQCELIELSRSSYYFKAQKLQEEDYSMISRIDEIFTDHPYYGTRRMSKLLGSLGHTIGRKKVRKYYEIMGIEPIYPKMNLSRRNQAHKVYPYLLNDYEIKRPNQVWSADITYIRLHQGFVYLVAIIDWYSRYILSWRISISLESDFCVEALGEALSKYEQPTIFNTDQGVQFTSKGFINVLEERNIAISMDGKGRALDNVFIERFWRSLKQEKIYRLVLNTVKEAKVAINEYMSFYNTLRLHQSLGYKTPEHMHFSTVAKNPIERIKKPKDFFINLAEKVASNFSTTWRNIISHFE